VTRWRDAALALAIAAVLVAAIWGPNPGGSAAPTDGPGASGSVAGSPLPVPSVVAAGLSLAATNVITTTTADHSIVTAVHLTARLRSSEVVMLRQAVGGPAMTFRLTAPQSVAATGSSLSALPATIGAGETLAIALTFDLRGISATPPAGAQVAGGAPPAPGTWLLTVDLVDIGGMRHHAETPVTIAASA
jgi:hypothetical protein